MPARELRHKMAEGKLTVVAVTEACLAAIRAREPIIQAWEWLDEKGALDAAAALDAKRDQGAPLGPSFGLPIGVKDVIDTQGSPTENGCSFDAGRMPDADAEVVRKLKEADAFVLGKTVTTELAFLRPSRTCNLHNPGHTPGGSSAGSAAALADGMVPLAIGTQTGGSINRPAAFCGVVGFKPSFSAISRTKSFANGAVLRSHKSAKMLISQPITHLIRRARA